MPSSIAPPTYWSGSAPRWTRSPISSSSLEGETTRSQQDILKGIGRKGDLTSKVRESLVSIGRLLLYLANEGDSMKWAKEARSQLRGMQRDVQSLSDHATYLANKITFLLDALLGVVFIEQNNIIKIFSIAAVVLMPPTLVASIYGMNFKHMPELDLAVRLSVRHRPDDRGGAAALLHLQMEEVAVGGERARTA